MLPGNIKTCMFGHSLQDDNHTHPLATKAVTSKLPSCDKKKKSVCVLCLLNNYVRPCNNEMLLNTVPMCVMECLPRYCSTVPALY